MLHAVALVLLPVDTVEALAYIAMQNEGAIPPHGAAQSTSLGCIIRLLSEAYTITTALIAVKQVPAISQHGRNWIFAARLYRDRL